MFCDRLRLGFKVKFKVINFKPNVVIWAFNLLLHDKDKRVDKILKGLNSDERKASLSFKVKVKFINF